MVAVKQSEERSLRSSGSLDSSETEIGPGSGEVAEIPQEFLGRRVKEDGDELGNRVQRVGEQGRTWSQRVALFPTVVSWAGWKWVNPRVGRDLYCSAKSARREMTTASLSRTSPSPSRRKIRSALLRHR